MSEVDDTPKTGARSDVWKKRVRNGALARSEAVKELVERHTLEFDQLHAAARQRLGLPPVGINFELTPEEIKLVIDARAKADNAKK